MFNGPNAPVGAGSLVPATEAQGDYIIKAITKIQTQGIASMVPTDASVRNFIDHTDSFMSTTVWTDSCRVSSFLPVLVRAEIVTMIYKH